MKDPRPVRVRRTGIRFHQEVSLDFRNQGGIYVPEYAMDEAVVQRSLKQIDDRLILWPPDSVSRYYRVVYRVSDWQEAVPVCAWMDDYGNPLPLSSGLVDKVNRLRPDAPNKDVSVDEHNDRLRERIARTQEQRGRDVMDEHRAKIERGQTSVSFGPLTKLGEMPNRKRRAA